MTGLCRSGKTAYPDQATAVEALAAILADAELMAPGQHIPRRAYSCDFCGDWHLTSSKAYSKGGRHG